MIRGALYNISYKKYWQQPLCCSYEQMGEEKRNKQTLGYEIQEYDYDMSNVNSYIISLWHTKTCHNN